jgi:hypothetical protein
MPPGFVFPSFASHYDATLSLERSILKTWGSNIPVIYAQAAAAMKRLIWIAFILFAMASPALAQYDDEPKPNQEADRQAISNLEQGFAHAIQLNNSTIYNTVFSDDFTGTTYYGEVINKAKQINLIQTSPNTYEFVRCTDIQVKIYRDVASVSSLRTERGSNQGHQFNRQFRVLRLYINTPRGWRVVAQQETQLPGR